MSGRYDVALWNGYLSSRWVSEFATTVYADQVVASFDTEEEAKRYIKENEDRFLDEYWEEMDSQYSNDIKSEWVSV